MKKAVFILLAIISILSLCSCNNAAATNNPAYELGMQALSIIDSYKDGKTEAKDAVTQIRSTVVGELINMYKDKTEQEKADIRKIDIAVGNIMLDLENPLKEQFKDNEGYQQSCDNSFNINYMQLKRALGLIPGKLDGMNTTTYELGIQGLDICEKYKNGEIGASDAEAQLDDINGNLITESERLREQYDINAIYTDIPEINAVTIIREDVASIRTIIAYDSRSKKNTSDKFQFIMLHDTLEDHLGK